MLTMLFAGIVAMAHPAQPSTDFLAGKKIGFFGDSYVYNHRRPQTETWHYKFAEKYGMEYQNYGRNGDRVASDTRPNRPGLYKRYVKLPADLDYVVIIAGHNDAYNLEADGGIDGFTQRADQLLTDLQRHCPHAQILWVTPWRGSKPEVRQSFKAVVKAIKHVCKRHHVSVLDASKSIIDPSNAAFRKAYFQSANDDAHLNAKGHDLFLPVAEKFLLKHLKQHEAR